MSTQTAPREVFLSYALDDESLCLELEKHLSVLKREGLITIWHKGQIGVGKDRDKEIGERLSTASIILLLLSASFVASDGCYSVEMSRAIERHETGEAFVIPVVLRPMDDWSNMPFGRVMALPSNGKPVVSWPDRDDAWASVAQGIRSVVQDGKLPPSVVPSPTLPAVWNIPYLRNIFFTGREHILQQLADALKRGQAIALSQPHVISGLGGIGKTQIAVEYAYQHYQDYQTILWTLADSREALVSGYLSIAKLLNLREKDEQDQAIIVEAVKSWLQTQSSWLLILDNADDLSLAYDFLPPMGGHLLITTRAQVIGTQAQRIEVDVMPQEVGALFLLHRSRLVAQDVALADVDEATQALARAICEELGGLPLALDQAGAYIEEVHCSLQDYQQRYRACRTALLKRRGKMAKDHPEPVAATWSLSFQRVEEQSPLAADLLRLCAFLHPDVIAVEIITKGASHLGPLLGNVSEDDLILDDAIATLSAYSLVRRNPSDQTLSIHRLVQAVLKDGMDELTRKQWAERAVRSVNEVFLRVKFETWPQCERYLPHALICAELVEQGQVESLEAADLLQKGGLYLAERGRYREAGELWQRVLEMREQMQGADHPDTGDSLHNLATLYRQQGKYQQADPLFERALRISEQTPGAEHISTSVTLNQMALLYQEQGKYTEAEPLLQRAISIREQKLGTNHPDTAKSLNNLALLYSDQGKYEQAEPLSERALSIREQQLGANHPDTANSLNNLAVLYKKQGKYEQAEPLYQRALAIDEKAYGETHPAVATDLNNLAVLYSDQGKYEQAEPLSERALSIREQQLGANHPNTAISLSTLALLYSDQGKYEQAEPLYKRALAITEQQLGPEHPSTATRLHNLATLYDEQGKYEQAEPLFKRALLIWRQTLGETHPNTQTVRGWYVSLLRKTGRDKEATALEQGQLPSEEH